MPDETTLVAASIGTAEVRWNVRGDFTTPLIRGHDRNLNWNWGVVRNPFDARGVVGNPFPLILQADFKEPPA